MFSKLGEKAAAAAAEAAVKAQAAAASAAEKTQAGLASAKQAAVEAKANATEDLDEITGVLRILTEATGQLGLSTIPFHDLTLGMKYHKQDIVAAFSSAGWDHGGGPKSSSRPELLHLLGMAHLAGSAYEDGPDGINKYLQGSDPAPLKKASDKNLLFTVACEDMQLAGVKISSVIGSLEPYDAKRAFMPAWYVAKDDVKKIVYLVVRGTASTKDALTDLNMKPSTWQGLTMHSGIWKCAQNVIEGANQYYLPLVAAGYKLVVVGHSLGAGTAAFVALQLRSGEGCTPVKEATAVCFACPGICSADAGMSAYVTSIVFDHDMVPRATTKSAFFLLDDIAQCKWRERAAADVAGAVGSGLSMIGASGLGEKFSSKILSAGERPGAAPEAEAPSSATARVESKQKIESCPPMLPAGRCLHIHRTSLSGGKKFSPGSKTVTLPEEVALLEVPAAFFSRLSFAPSFIDDHSMDFYLASLRKLVGARAI